MAVDNEYLIHELTRIGNTLDTMRDVMRKTDEIDAAMGLTEVKYSPLTSKVIDAASMTTHILTRLKHG